MATVCNVSDGYMKRDGFRGKDAVVGLHKVSYLTLVIYVALATAHVFCSMDGHSDTSYLIEACAITFTSFLKVIWDEINVSVDIKLNV